MYLEWSSPEEVDLSRVRHKALQSFYYDRGVGVRDDLGAPEAAELREAMVVSDAAKKYAIAAALHDANSWHSAMRYIIIPAATYVSGGAVFHLLTKHPGLNSNQNQTETPLLKGFMVPSSYYGCTYMYILDYMVHMTHCLPDSKASLSLICRFYLSHMNES